MRGHELLETIENLDPAYIEAAACKPRVKRLGWIKWGALAACLCFVLAMVFQIFNNNIWGAKKPAKLNLEGAVLQSGNGTLTYHTDNFSDHILAFTIVIKNEIPDCHVAFSAENILNEWTDDAGVIRMENEQFQVITPCVSFEPNFSYKVVDDILSITVNGKEAMTMPTAPGTYEIVIDYGELYNRFDIVAERVEVWGFGAIVINSEKFT